MNRLYAYVILFAGLFTPAYAELYLELGLEGGGEEMIGTNFGESIMAGGGLKLSAGIQNYVNEQQTGSVRLSLGYLFDSIDAVNGDADFDTLVFDAMYLMHSGRHVLGLGGTMHLSPRYRDKVDGYAPVDTEYDDALGLVVQYGYQVTPGLELGLRLNNLEYETDFETRDASSFGIYLSNGF
jgi:hypothetical protein